MGKRVVSLVLVLCLILGCNVTAYAEGADTDTSQAIADLEAWENVLGEYTTTDVNAYTPADAENLLSADEQDHAYDPEPEEEDVIYGDYAEGEVLYARSSGRSLFSLRNTDDGVDEALAELGIVNAKAVFTETDDSGIALFSFGGSSTTTWYHAEITGSVLETVEGLKQIDGIVDAEPNYIYTTTAVGEAMAAECENSWYLNCEPNDHKDRNGMRARHGWDHVWEKNGEDFAPGEGTIVAVIDTGVDYTHQDLASSMWVNTAEFEGVTGVDDDGNGYIDDIYGIDATANTRYAAAGNPMDYNGHGTHVAGIIAMANNGIGGVGIAYGAKIMAIKAGQATGTFSSADIVEAIEYAVAMGADVINMSFGGTGKSSAVEAALENAFSICVLVAAAGNDGVPTTDAPENFIKKEDIYPAAYSFVLGIMASDENGNKAEFSNWDYYSNLNAEYEMIAPGTNVYSALPGNRYAAWNGTSMAAPCVAAAAAVIRSCYPDKDEYNSRFVMGQLASATEELVVYQDAIRELHTYPKLDLYDSLTKLPQPNLSVSQVFALDNADNGTENDGDRIMDAGEVVDLGIAICNQWGKTGEVTITADALSVGGVANPYVEFVTDTVTLTSIGAYSSADNGFLYEGGYLYSVDNPIRFVLDPETPNDTEIRINLCVTTANGWDEEDTAVYTAEEEFTFRVQRGKAVRGHITKDTVWDNDHYWIIENSVVIDEGVTLTVEPGTQIQFWSSDYEDAYGGMTMAYINNNGTLNMIGTEKAPIECFPGADFEDYMVQISGTGTECIEYCYIVNPRLGYTAANSTSSAPIDNCAHTVLTQELSTPLMRYINSGTIKEESHSLLYRGFYVKNLSYSTLNGFCSGGTAGDVRYIEIETGTCNQFVECTFRQVEKTGRALKNEDSVFLMNAAPSAETGSVISVLKSISATNPVLSDICTYDGGPASM